MDLFTAKLVQEAVILLGGELGLVFETEGTGDHEGYALVLNGTVWRALVDIALDGTLQPKIEVQLRPQDDERDQEKGPTLLFNGLTPMMLGIRPYFAAMVVFSPPDEAR